MKIKQVIKKIVFGLFPHKIKNKRVLFESNGPYDNGYALFKYANDNRNDLDCYFFAPYSAKKDIPEKYIKKCLFYSPHQFRFAFLHPFISLKKRLYANTFDVEFSSYGHTLSWNNATKKVYVFHGIGLKGAKIYFNDILKTFDKAIVPTLFVKENFEKYYENSNGKYDILPCIRATQIKSDSVSRNLFWKRFNIQDSKILLVMTTFRRNEDNSFDANSVLTIPLNLNQLNATLVESNVKMIIKLHHALDFVDTSKFGEYSNIYFLKNKELFKMGLNPTSIMSLSDALISDYSSASTDYLLLDKPIGFLIPDFEKYKEEINGGFIFDNPLSLMPGEKFVDQNGLQHFITKLGENIDTYHDERERVSHLLNGQLFENPEDVIINKYIRH